MQKSKKNKIKNILLISVLLALFAVVTLWLYDIQVQLSELHNIQRVEDIQNIGIQLEKYHNQFGEYPCPPHKAFTCYWQTELRKVADGKFIRTWDPKKRENYIYLTDGIHSAIGAILDKRLGTCMKNPDYYKHLVVYQTSTKKLSTHCDDNFDDSYLR